MVHKSSFIQSLSASRNHFCCWQTKKGSGNTTLKCTVFQLPLVFQRTPAQTVWRCYFCLWRWNDWPLLIFSIFASSQSSSSGGTMGHFFNHRKLTSNFNWGRTKGVDCPTFKSAKTDSYFHILVFVFVSCLLCFMTNIKLTNMKNTSGKSARTKGASQQVGDVDDKQQIHTLGLRQKLKFFLVWVFCTSPNNQTNK